MKKQITNSCYRSQFSVIPANWDKPSAPVTKNWRIYYRYYDMQFKSDKKLWGKMFNIKGMNDTADLHEKQAITKSLIEQEIELLDSQQWNPITNRFMTGGGVAAGGMNFSEALDWAYNRLTGVRGTLVDIKSVINGIKKSATILFDQSNFINYASLPVTEIRRKHIKEMLDHCYLLNPRFTDKRYNKYKAYLSKLYRELVDAEIVEANPINDIRQKQVVKQLKQILTDAEAVAINNHLYDNHYYFWRFIQIFFYSDARETEMMDIRKDSNVDIEKQEFVVTILKGKAKRDERKQISNEVVELWQQIMSEAKPGEYLFSKGLRPGASPIRPDQLGRRWNKYVKGKKKAGGLDINKDLRSLNHLHLTKVSEAIGIRAASASRGHTSTVITMTRYDVGHKKRLLDEVKNAGIKFGK